MEPRVPWDPERPSASDTGSNEEHEHPGGYANLHLRSAQVLMQGLTMCYVSNHLEEKHDGETVSAQDIYGWVVPQVRYAVEKDWATEGWAVGFLMSVIKALAKANWISCNRMIQQGMPLQEFLTSRIGVGSRWREMTLSGFMSGPFYKMLIFAGHSDVTAASLNAALNS